MTTKHFLIGLALGLIGIALAFFVSTAQARYRPTFGEARIATHIVLDDYADLVDGNLIVGPCRRVGSFTTVIRARIDGPVPQRYRIIVTGTPSRDFSVTVRAR